jgi:exosortase
MTAPRAIAGVTRSTIWYAVFLAACLAVFSPSLRELLRLALTENTSSHILLVPFISAGLILLKRHGLFEKAESSPRAAVAVALAGVILFGLNWRFGSLLRGGDPLGLSILSLVLLVWAGFLFFYGWRTFHSLQFPLIFLVLAVPLPQFLVDGLIEWLRRGSAEVTYWLFRATATPVFRRGFIFAVPGVTIDIAPECSGIRSAIALLITCLLAGYLFLRRGWARTALLVAAVPVLVIKNGIRIVTLTLLAIHVDPGFLTGNLHQEGGFLFFLIGLLILWPVLTWLQTAEGKFMNRGGTPPGPRSGMPRSASGASVPQR